MSKKIYIISIAIMVLAIAVYFISEQFTKFTAASKGEAYLNEVLTEDFELLGKSNTMEDSLLYSTILSSKGNSYDSYKFADDNGILYYISISDGSLMKCIDGRYEETAIENEKAACDASVEVARKLFPYFFEYDYTYMANPHFGDSAIVISQQNSEGVFTGNYIYANMSDDKNVCEMEISYSYNPSADVLSKKEIEQIAYQRAVYITECIEAKLSGEKMGLLGNLNYAMLDDSVNLIVSDIQMKTSCDMDKYEINIHDLSEIELTSYIQIAFDDWYWWKVWVENVEDNLSEFYSGNMNVYSFVFYIDPRTGEITQYEVTVD